MSTLNVVKPLCGLGSVPDLAGGAYSAPSNPLAGLKGPTSTEEGSKCSIK